MSRVGTDMSDARTSRPLRVCLDARLVSGEWGGVEQVIIGLAKGLGTLTDSPDEYLFLALPGETAWLEPYLAGGCRIIMAREGRSAAPGYAGLLGRKAKGALRRIAAPAQRDRWQLGASDGVAEASGAEIMHFTMQVGFRTTLPSIYHPHDLQHLHLPEFFTREAIDRREATYRALCDQASIVATMSTWGKRDVVESYGLPDERVAVIPWAAVTDAYREPSPTDLAAARAEISVDGAFALFPAKAWPHKNHARLLEAVALLRSRDGIDLPLVLTGSQGGLELPILQQADALGIRDLVHFTGFVAPATLRALYHAARLMVFPSLFEGWGMPILEAFAAGLPVACSTVTCLPDLAAGAALFFDPLNPAAMADAIRTGWLDEAVRTRLAADGRLRVRAFSWEHTARLCRAHYRQLAGRTLSDQDRSLLTAPPLA